jgi:hypothetical protein
MIRFRRKGARRLAVLTPLACFGFRIAAHRRELVAWPPDGHPRRLADTASAAATR